MSSNNNGNTTSNTLLTIFNNAKVLPHVLLSSLPYKFKQHPKTYSFIGLFVLLQLYRSWTYWRNSKSVKGKVILITGAGSGLGKNMALRLSGMGANVVLWDINDKGLQTVAKKITDNYGMAWTFVCDVTDRNAVYQTAERVIREVGDVDILINNAGIVSGDWITQIPDRNIERTFQVNVISHFWTIKSFLPAMLKKNDGHIVTIASAAGCGGTSKLTDYCASKYAAVGLDESLRLELLRLGATGVKTTCICPFFIHTGMFDGAQTKFSWILPILSEDYASSRIVQAIVHDDAFVMMPRFLYLNHLVRFLLPTAASDWVFTLLGVNNSMDKFMGRKPAPSNANASNNNASAP